MSRLRWPSCAAIGLVAIVAAYAALLPLGRWQADEYIQAAAVRAQGWSYYIERLSDFSPRPSSELTLFLYYRVVAALHRPLIGPFLSLHWLALAASAFITMRPATVGQCVWRTMIGAGMLAMVLVGHAVSELFYWPAGTAPYLTTLAGMMLTLALVLDRRDRGRAGVFATAAALTVTAAASECGAMFVAAFAACLLATRPRGASLLMLGIPAVVASACLLVIATSARVSGNIPLPGSRTFHRPFGSLAAAWRALGSELVAPDAVALTPWVVLLGLTLKLAFFAGVRLSAAEALPVRPRPASLLAFAAAVAVASGAMLAAQFYAYGGLCCSRHSSLRQCWFILALAAIAAACPPVRRPPAWHGPLLLMIAAALPLASAGRGLLAEHRLVQATSEARDRTWRSGSSAGPAMVFLSPPDGPIIHGAALPAGRFDMGDDPPWYASGVMLFFHKRALEIRPPA